METSLRNTGAGGALVDTIRVTDLRIRRCFRVELFSSDLQATGRFVDYFFSLACIPAAGVIFRRCFPQTWRWNLAAFSCLFLTSPIYLFWSRTFMIEMAALFFSLCFVAAAIPVIKLKFSARNLIFFGVTLLPALLQKVTTVLPLCLIVAALLAAQLVRHRGVVGFKDLAKIAVAFCTPMAIGYAWVMYTDHVKMANQFAYFITSGALRHFNYGPLRDRLNPSFYKFVLWDRVMLKNVGGPIGLTFIIIGLLLAKEKGHRLFIALCLAAFVIPFVVFEHLHLVHDYYQTANAIFVIAAVSVSLSSLAELNQKWKAASVVVAMLVMGMNLYCFKRGYASLESIDFGPGTQTLAISQRVRCHTTPSQSVLIYGYDWSSEIPFFSQRRALAVRDTFTAKEDAEVLRKADTLVGEYPVGAVVLCSRQETEGLAVADKFPSFTPARVGRCTVFSR